MFAAAVIKAWKKTILIDRAIITGSALALALLYEP
jgi:hypothetical protein